MDTFLSIPFVGFPQSKHPATAETLRFQFPLLGSTKQKADKGFTERLSIPFVGFVFIVELNNPHCLSLNFQFPLLGSISEIVKTTF